VLSAISYFDTNSTTFVISNLLPNKEYTIRVAGVTRAGSGLYSTIINPTIFSNSADKSENSGMVQDGPSNNGSKNLFSGASQQQLGSYLNTKNRK
jgi:hypothetical protein